jgi:hypothetical protein
MGILENNMISRLVVSTTRQNKGYTKEGGKIGICSRHLSEGKHIQYVGAKTEHGTRITTLRLRNLS